MQRFDANKVRKMVALWKEDLSLDELAAAVGVKRAKINEWANLIRRSGYDLPKRSVHPKLKNRRETILIDICENMNLPKKKHVPVTTNSRRRSSSLPKYQDISEIDKIKAKIEGERIKKDHDSFLGKLPIKFK